MSTNKLAGIPLEQLKANIAYAESVTALARLVSVAPGMPHQQHEAACACLLSHLADESPIQAALMLGAGAAQFASEGNAELARRAAVSAAPSEPFPTVNETIPTNEHRN